MTKEEITLNDYQQKAVKVLEKLINGMINNTEAARELGLSVRQVIRKKQSYLDLGMRSLVHGNKGKSTSNKIAKEVKSYLVTLYKYEYIGWNFSHFRDELLDTYDLEFSYAFLYNLFQEYGIKSPRKHRKAKKSHPPRPRRENAGELIQVDASNHCWITLGDCKHQLHGAIDDATGIVLALRLEDQETNHAYRLLLKDIISNYGIPECLYTDYRNVFRINNRLSEDEVRNGKQRGDTRFAAMCHRLGMDIISTMSPQAKGRIERLWNTLQDRLTKELEKAGIATKKEANEYINKVFLPRYNARFASKLDYNRNRFISVNADFDYNYELALIDTRSVLSHSYISYHGQCFSIEQNGKAVYIDGRPQVAIWVLLDNTIAMRHNNQWYQLVPVTRVPVKPTRKTSSDTELHKLRSINSTKALVNNPNHPWKQYKTKLMPK